MGLLLPARGRPAAVRGGSELGSSGRPDRCDGGRVRAAFRPDAHPRVEPTCPAGQPPVRGRARGRRPSPSGRSSRSATSRTVRASTSGEHPARPCERPRVGAAHADGDPAGHQRRERALPGARHRRDRQQAGQHADPRAEGRAAAETPPAASRCPGSDVTASSTAPNSAPGGHAPQPPRAAIRPPSASELPRSVCRSPVAAGGHAPRSGRAARSRRRRCRRGTAARCSAARPGRRRGRRAGRADPTPSHAPPPRPVAVGDGGHRGNRDGRVAVAPRAGYGRRTQPAEERSGGPDRTAASPRPRGTWPSPSADAPAPRRSCSSTATRTAGALGRGGRDLARDHHVVAYDVRGAGASPPPDATSGYALPTCSTTSPRSSTRPARDRPVHLVGHDWGAIQGFAAAGSTDAAGRASRRSPPSRRRGWTSPGPGLRARLAARAPRDLAALARRRAAPGTSPPSRSRRCPRRSCGSRRVEATLRAPGHPRPVADAWPPTPRRGLGLYRANRGRCATPGERGSRPTCRRGC